jgi:hypothetical protein
MIFKQYLKNKSDASEILDLLLLDLDNISNLPEGISASISMVAGGIKIKIHDLYGHCYIYDVVLVDGKWQQKTRSKEKNNKN